MPRRFFIIAYDISEDKTRTEVFHILRGQGDHVQYSVFLCQLDKREYAELTGRLGALINHATDQIMVLDLGPDTNPLERGMLVLGKPYCPAARVTVV